MNLNLTRWLLILTLFVSVTSGCQVFQGGTLFEKDRPVFYDPVFESLSRTGETSDSSFHPDVRRSLPADDSDSETQWALPGSGSVSSLRTNLESGGSQQTASDKRSPRVSPEIHQESEPGPFSRGKDFVTTQYRVANPLEEKLWGGPSGLDIILSDQKRFYSRENFRPFALTLGISAIVANTSIDQEFADWYQDDVRSESTDDFSRIAKSFGEQWPMVGAYLTASALGRLPIADTRLAIWGDRSFRSMLVGVPPLLFLQKALGSSRPNDVPAFSDWRFWEDENGASGHTFVGAVPFPRRGSIGSSSVSKIWLDGRIDTTRLVTDQRQRSLLITSDCRLVSGLPGHPVRSGNRRRTGSSDRSDADWEYAGDRD